MKGGKPHDRARGSSLVKENQGFEGFKYLSGVVWGSWRALDTWDTQNGGERWAMTGRG